MIGGMFIVRSKDAAWRALAAQQLDLVARRQLNELGYDRFYVAAQVRAGRWRLVSDVVVATVTGELSRDQLMWAGVLHAGPGSAIAGRSALELADLSGWQEDDVHVSLAKSHDLEPLPGVSFRQTRRPIDTFVTRGTRLRGLPVWKPAPAALLVAGYDLEPRPAFGLLAAAVQQQVVAITDLERAIKRLHPLRRAREFRGYLVDFAGGVESTAERDVAAMCRRARLPLPHRQTRRKDASGRWRYTDCEWVTSLGRVVALEVDGAFHLDADTWIDDMERERDIVTTGPTVIRCSGYDLRETPDAIARSLQLLGVLPLAA